MEDIQNNRLVRRFFKCSKCKEIESKLVNPFANNIYCSNCSSRISEVSEKDYKKNKNKIKKKEEIKVGNQMPYRPNEELLRRASDKYNKPPSREIKHNDKNDDKHKKKKEKKTNRHQSTSHYSNINFNNMNNDNYNNNNINNIHMHNNYNNINQININNNNDHNHRHNHNHNHNHRRREHSMDPNTQNTTNNFFSDFFRGMGFTPFMDFGFSIQAPFMNNNRHGHGNNPFRITIQRHNVSNDVFDPIFSSFGSIFNGVFQDNFSSNFSSNYRGNFFDEIIRIIERNQEEARKNAHPPASEESLNKLKKFKMNEKYCKKDKKGKYELPNCCICLSEIGKGEKTVLLPCGHMFHWKCCLTWLKSNNTCPMCRFEIK